MKLPIMVYKVTERTVTYATVTRPNQPTATYETVSLHEEDGTRSSNKAAASNVYTEPSDLHSDPQS